MIRAEKIKKSFGNIEVLAGIDLSISKGEIVSIIGKSGAGKSTLLQIMGTVEGADSGKVIIDNVDTSQLRSNALAKFRNEKIGFVFQFHHLLPEFTAIENICIPAFIKGVRISVAQKKAKELLELLDLKNRFDHKPEALSGGEQQRVAIARALINDPAVILADEPSGNLDSKSSSELHKLIQKLRSDLNQTFVIVTHNKDLANMADRKLEIIDGIISGK